MADKTNTDAPVGARVTIPGVELVKVGTWGGHALTEAAQEDKDKHGGVKITEEMVVAMAEAGQDSEVALAPMKPGHFDDRFDGQPAMGWVRNLRVSDDKTTLLGDLVDIPVPLYPLIKTGYKQRSVEYGLDHVTPSGKKYAAVLTGLALLGTQAPAVTSLAEMADVYASKADTAHIPPPAAVALEDSNNTAHTGEHENEGESPVDILEKIKEKLGLAAEATDDEVLSALEAALADAAQSEDGGEPDGAASAAAALSAAGAETVTVSKDVFLSMQGTLQGLQEKEQERANVKLVDDAVNAGKISTAEAPLYLANLGKPDMRAGVAAMLSAMPEQRVATTVTPAGESLSDVDLAKRWAAQNQ